MKRFLLKVTFFLVLLFLILFLIKKSAPFYWGNPRLGEKISYVLDNQTDYNSFFIGSSSVHRQINPLIFDEVTQLHSFNLGMDATFFLEAHYILDYFLKNNNQKQLKIFLTEIQPHVMVKNNLHTPRNKYYMDFKRLKMALNYHWKSKNYRQIYFHSIAFLENQLCLGEIKTLLSSNFENATIYKREIIKQKGFFPMDQHLSLDKNNKGLLRNRAQFINSEKYKNRKNMTEADIMTYETSIGKNIHNYTNINYNKVEFYTIPQSIPIGPKYEFDYGHFNTKGSAIFSRKLGEAYNKFVIIEN